MPTRREDQQLEQILQLSKSQAHPPVPPSSMRPSEPSTAPSHGNVPPTPGIAYSPSLVEPTLSSPSVDIHAGAIHPKSTRTPTDRGTPTIRSPATGGTPAGASTGWESTGSTVRRELERGLDGWDGPRGDYRPPNVHGAVGAGARAMVGSSLRFLNSSGGDAAAAATAELAPAAEAAVPDSEDESSSRLSSKKGSISIGAADRSRSTIKSFTPTHPTGAAAVHNKTSTIDTTLSSHAGASAERVSGAVARRATESIQMTSSSGLAGGKGDAPSSSAAAAGAAAAATRAIGNGLLAPLPNFKRRTVSTSDGPAQAPLPIAAAVAPVPSAAPAQPSASTSAAPATVSDGTAKKSRPRPKVRPPAPRSPVSPAGALARPAPAAARAASPPLVDDAAGPSNAPASPSVPARKKGASKTYSSKRDGVPPPLSRRKAAAALEKEEKAREKEKTYKSRALLSDTDDSAVEAVPGPRSTTTEVIELPSSNPAVVVAAPTASKGKAKAKARDSGAGSAADGAVGRGDPIDLLSPRPPPAAGDRAASSSSTSARKDVAAPPQPPPPPPTHSTGSMKTASKAAPVPPAKRRTSPRKKTAAGKQQQQQPAEADSDATESEADEIRVERRPAPPPARTASSGAVKKGRGGAALAAPLPAAEEPALDESSPLSPLFTQPGSPPVKAAPAGRKRPSAGRKRPSAVVASNSDSSDDVPVAELALGTVASASSAGRGSKGRPAASKKRRVVVESDDEADDEEDDAVEAPADVPPVPAPAAGRSSSKVKAPVKRPAAKAAASKAASAKSKRAAQPSPPPAQEPRGLEGQPTVAVLGDTTDAETTDGRSPAKRARTTTTAAAAKGRGKAAQKATAAAGKKAAAPSKGKGRAVETEDEEDDEAGDEENAPAPAPPSPAKPSPIKRVAAAAATSLSKPGGLRHGTPTGAAGGGASSTPSVKIPRHMPPFKDMAARGRAGSVGAGGVLIPPALGLAARPLSRLGSETPGSGVKLTSIVSRTAHLVVGGPASTPTGQGASTSHGTPSPSTAYKSRTSGLSRRGLARTPLLSVIAPAPKRLAPAPVEKKRAKKGDLNPDDYSDGEWEEMEKERRRKERECDVWD